MLLKGGIILGFIRPRDFLGVEGGSGIKYKRRWEMVSYYKTFQKRFEWKFEAKEFVQSLKRKAKKSGLKISVKIEPLAKSISTAKKAEHRITAYYVRWFYKR